MYNHEEKVIKNEIKEMSKNKKMQPGFFLLFTACTVSQYHNTQKPLDVNTQTEQNNQN